MATRNTGMRAQPTEDRQELRRASMTPWETKILDALANHVRALSLEQVAQTWWPHQRTGFRRTCDSMRERGKNGCVRIDKVLSRPVVPFTERLLLWEPGQWPPNFESVSAHFRRRCRAAAGLVKVITATRRTRELSGSGGARRRLKLTQMTQELCVTEVFLHHRDAGI